jgi:hypothetical protein
LVFLVLAGEPRELQAAHDAAAAVPARIRLGEIAPDMVRLEAEVKQIIHAIRMAACNAEITLAPALVLPGCCRTLGVSVAASLPVSVCMM